MHRTATGEPAPGAGVLTPQARLTYRGRTGPLDDVVGAGFVLACTGDPRASLDEDLQAFLDAIGTHMLRLLPADTQPGPAAGDETADPDSAIDVDGTYLAHLATAGHVAALIRPDHYLFGTATSMRDLAGLADDLRRQLSGPEPGPTAGSRDLDRHSDVAAASSPADVTSHPAGTTPTGEHRAPIWRPDPEAAASSVIARFGRYVTGRTGVEFGTYLDLQRWSAGHLEQFWGAVWDFFDIQADGSHDEVLADAAMPGARWFPGTRLNYAEHALRHSDDDTVAVTAVSEDGTTTRTTWTQLRAQVAALAQWLRDAGVQRGDRVVGYLPNTTPALIAFLATASIGAIWSACAQDYAAHGAAARFAQLDPVILFAADGYHWNGKAHDRSSEVTALQRSLPTLRATVHIPTLDPAATSPARDPGAPAPLRGNTDDMNVTWQQATAAPAELRFDRVDFDTPLWVLFSSGTTGLPKGIVHGHGGVVLEHHKLLGLHLDLGPDKPLFWYTTTNWMMWNLMASGLLTGAPVVLYDGNPTYPDPLRLWQIAADHRVAVLGVSPGYLLIDARAGLTPGRDLDLRALRTLGATGAPLPAQSYQWVRDNVGSRIQVASTSGGTDVVSGFAGSAPTTDVWAGEISAPLLGVALEAWNTDGQPVTSEVGELVVTRPMPSMPLYFWNDPDDARYRDAYFSAYPGVWRHGDWMLTTERGSVIISGRSDSTLNRHGVRLGSADIYDVVDKLPQIREALMIGAELGDGGYWLVLFAVLADGAALTDELTRAIKAAIAAQASPRHVPDDIIAVTAIPHTRTPAPGRNSKSPSSGSSKATPSTRSPAATRSTTTTH